MSTEAGLAHASAEEWTPEQAGEFKRAMAELPPSPHRVIEQPPPLGPGEVRQLLRECVTVVRPGETLILRCPESWTPAQAGEMQRWAEQWLADYAPDVKAFVVPHLEIAVVQPESDAAFLERLERAWPEMTRREMKRQAANWTERR